MKKFIFLLGILILSCSADARQLEKGCAGETFRIPQGAVKSGRLDFLAGCWKTTSIEYNTKKKLDVCFCFSGDGKTGRAWVYDPRHTGTSCGTVSASLDSCGVLRIMTSEMRESSGIPTWAAQESLCRQKGAALLCTEHMATGQSQSFETGFEKVGECPR